MRHSTGPASVVVSLTLALAGAAGCGDDGPTYADGATYDGRSEDGGGTGDGGGPTDAAIDTGGGDVDSSVADASDWRDAATDAPIVPPDAAIDGPVLPPDASLPTCDLTLTPQGPQTITIIESQSSDPGHNMDAQWLSIATAGGHTATIVPQTTLDSITNFDATDILIVSSGIIDVSPARRAVIDAFAASGRGVYIQGEYLTTYTTNIGFGEIVNAHGGTFNWVGTVAGQQDPTAVVSCLATIPEVSLTLNAYWYAATGDGSGDGLEVIHIAPGGQPIGWWFCLPDGGLVITNTDQDFIRDQYPGTPEHMRNVLAWLADAANCDQGIIIP